MAAMSPGTALRNLQQAHATLKKIRHLLRLARESEGSVDSCRIIRAGWEGLGKAVQRYATALLVRLRRLARNDPAAFDDGDDEPDSD